MSAKTTFGELTYDEMAKVGDLGETLVEFAKRTNPYFYFYVEEIWVSSDLNDNIQVKYQVTDIEGDSRTLTVTIEDGKVVCEPAKFFNFGKDEDGRPVRNLIAGVTKAGKPINATGKNIDASYMSELMLLLTDLSKICSGVGLSVGRVMFPGNSKDISFTDMYPMPDRGDGDVTVKFTDGAENMADLGRMVDAMQANAPQSTAKGAQLVPKDTPIRSLSDDYNVVDMETGRIHPLSIVVVEGAQYNDVTDFEEMTELAQNEGLPLVVEGSSGREINGAFDLVINDVHGDVLGSDLMLVHGIPLDVEASSAIGYAHQQGVRLISAR